MKRLTFHMGMMYYYLNINYSKVISCVVKSFSIIDVFKTALQSFTLGKSAIALLACSDLAGQSVTYAKSFIELFLA